MNSLNNKNMINMIHPFPQEKLKNSLEELSQQELEQQQEQELE